MKVSSNKKSSKAKVSTNKSETGHSENKANYSIQEISNGFIVEKSWSESKPDYKYHCVKTYYPTKDAIKID